MKLYGHSFTVLLQVLSLACTLFAQAAQAQTAGPRNGLTVTMPNGFARIEQHDMVLKTTAGDVRWSRQWNGQEWRFNPQWESLSQSWRNLTGSQMADLPTGSGAGNGGGCWVSTDEDWRPPAPENGTIKMLAPRSTPFNRSMAAGANGGYSASATLVIDHASLCPGVASNRSPGTVEALRRGNSLFIGEPGELAYNNRTTIRKQAITFLNAVPATEPYALLNSRRITLNTSPNARGYRWQDRAGPWMDYNTQGQVVAYGDRNDNTIWLQRDTTGVLRGVVDANGRVLYTLHYNGDLLVEVRDYPDDANPLDLPARTVRYAYDAANRLTQVTDVRGNVTRYEYDSSNRITRITDPEGRVEQLSYNGDTVLKRIAPDGGVTDYSFEFDDVNKQFNATVTGPQTTSGRRVEKFIHNRVGQPVSRILNSRIERSVRYDVAGRRTLNSNARGLLTQTTQNEFEQVVETVHPDATTTKRAYSPLHLSMTESTDELGIKTTYQRDARGNLVRTVRAAGTSDQRVTELNLNRFGQIVGITRKGRVESTGQTTPDAIWQIDYESSGQVTKTIDPEGNARHYSYNRAGHLVRTVDGRGNATVYEVDAQGNLIKVTDAIGRSHRFEYDRVGNVLRWVNPQAKATLAARDSMNRLVDITSPVGGVHRLQRDAQGLPISETDADGRTSSFEYDNFRRALRRIDGLGNATEYLYAGAADLAGGAVDRPTEQKFPTFIRRLRYDQRERPIQISLLNNSERGSETLITSIAYDGRGQPKIRLDSYGESHSFIWNAHRQLEELTNRLGNKTRVAHDSRGNIVLLTDARGKVYKFEYDRNDRMVKEVTPLGEASTYRYDGSGNLVERTTPNGHIVSLQFDAANRVIEIKNSRNPDNRLERTVTYTWDGADNLIAWRDTDHSRIKTTSATVTFDDANRKTGETITYPSGHTLSYAQRYSAAGKKIQMLWPDGTGIAYGYSAHGELETVSVSGEGTLSVNQFKWMAPAMITMPGGTTQERSYDGLMNLEGLNVKNTGRQTLLNLANRYGKGQEIKTTTRTDNFGGASTLRSAAYTYDAEQRLIRSEVEGNAVGNYQEAVTLDALGNRLTRSTEEGAWTYDADNRLLQRGTGTNATYYHYDNSGNLIRKIESANSGGQSSVYRYDTENRLIEVSLDVNLLVARYGYDPLGRRLWKEVFRDRQGSPLATAQRILYLYNKEGLVAEATQSIKLNGELSVTDLGAPLISTLYGARPDAPFNTGMILVKTKGSNGQDVVAYLHHDHLQTPIYATDKMQRVVWAAQYNDYGSINLITPRGSTDRPSVNISLRSPGQSEDPETGMHYNFHRYYDPTIGRYIQPDPIRMKTKRGSYVYAGSNPTNRVDPNGLLDIFIGGMLDGTKKIVKGYQKKFEKIHPERDSRYFEWIPEDKAIEAIRAANREMHPCEPLNIIGHSYGGDTAASISRKLSEIGINVDLAITVDPVSHGFFGGRGPAVSDLWVNVNASPAISSGFGGDAWAFVGGKWGDWANGRADSHYNAPFNHEEFDDLFEYTPRGGNSGLEVLLDSSCVCRLSIDPESLD